MPEAEGPWSLSWPGSSDGTAGLARQRDVATAREATGPHWGQEGVGEGGSGKAQSLCPGQPQSGLPHQGCGPDCGQTGPAAQQLHVSSAGAQPLPRPLSLPTAAASPKKAGSKGPWRACGVPGRRPSQKGDTSNWASCEQVDPGMGPDTCPTRRPRVPGRDALPRSSQASGVSGPRLPQPLGAAKPRPHLGTAGGGAGGEPMGRGGAWHGECGQWA